MGGDEVLDGGFPVRRASDNVLQNMDVGGDS